MLFTADQGAVVTVNGGRTWSSWYNQPTAQLYHVTTDNQFPYWVYGGQRKAAPSHRHPRNGGQSRSRRSRSRDDTPTRPSAPGPSNLNLGGRVSLRQAGTARNVRRSLRSARTHLRTMRLLFLRRSEELSLNQVLWKQQPADVTVRCHSRPVARDSESRELASTARHLKRWRDASHYAVAHRRRT